jgi:hypothetical protein
VLVVEGLEVRRVTAIDVAHAAPVDEILHLEPHGPPVAELHPEPGAAGGDHPQARAAVGGGAERIGDLELDLCLPHPGACEEHEAVAHRPSEGGELAPDGFPLGSGDHAQCSITELAAAASWRTRLSSSLEKRERWACHTQNGWIRSPSHSVAWKVYVRLVSQWVVKVDPT